MKRIIVFLSLAVFILSSTSIAAQEDIKPLMKKYGELMLFLQRSYVDSVDLTSISEKMLREGVRQLDPHSVYIPSEEVARMNAPLKGEFGGIGVEFAVISDTLTIQSLVAGGPSEKGGLLPGDRIVAIDGDTVAGKNLSSSKIHEYLRGEKGTEVRLLVSRRGCSDREYILVRDMIPMISLDAAYEAMPGILYFRLSRFAMTSFEEVMEAFSDYGHTPKGMILDLRGNSGGYVHVALKLASQFLEKKSLILYTEGKSSPRRSESSSGYGVYRKKPLIILVDEFSASASEILSGAVQDWDRGLVIGRRTYGKGLVQKPLKFSDGSELRLTIARYHTPSGRVIQRPYQLGKADQYHKDFYARLENGEMFSPDSIRINDSLAYQTLRAGRVVYGGGGIVPDLFVPADTLLSSTWYSAVLKGGHVLGFANRYLDVHRSELQKKYRTFESFSQAYDADNTIYREFTDELGRQKGLPRQEASPEIHARLNLMLKALLARGLFGQDKYYFVLNQADPVYRKALEVFSHPESLDEQLRKVFYNEFN